MTDAPLDLAAAVERLAAGSVTGIADVRRDPIEYDAFMAGRTLTRVRGSVVVDGRTEAWSFIEKRTEGPSVAPEYLYDNGAREFAAYRSGMLDDLAPGLRAPRLLAAERDTDGGLTLWIEDLAASGRAPLTSDQLLRAARHLGRLTGRWMGRVPEHPWLFGGWIERHSQPHAIAEGLAAVRDAHGDPAIGARIGGSLDEAVRLIEAQDELGSALGRLAPTLCHHDAVAANVFSRERDGSPETVLIDWESVGPGPAGADLASLLFSSPRRGDFSARLLPELIPGCLSAYEQGIAETGASVNPDEVRLGLHASISLRWTLVRDVTGLLGDPSRARRGSAPHETPDAALAELLALVPVLLDSAAEARRLISKPSA
jgi:hypothetical protein